MTALAPYLTGRRILVVLDNLEQLMGAAPLVAELAAACPDLVVLATSRAPLRIRAEHELPLPRSRCRRPTRWRAPPTPLP